MKITQEEIHNSGIKGLSLKPPFSELMLPPYNKQETRTWETRYRGLVLICASVLPYADRELVELCGQEQYSRILQLLGVKWYNVVKRGNAIAVGRLVDCLPGSVEPVPSVAEYWTYVKYNPKLWVHKFTDVTPIKTFPIRGQLNYFDITGEQKERIKIL